MLIQKAAPSLPVLMRTSACTLSLKAGTTFWEASGVLATFTSDTGVSMPCPLVAGDDIAVWLETAGTLAANKDFTTPVSSGARLVGGAHYAPGGNGSSSQTGGNTSPQINEFSLWDLAYRPACPDPRGMTCVNGAFWVDIYLLGVDYLTNGTSRNNVAIANGTVSPKRPILFGGNGSATERLHWWGAAEIMRSVGKQLLSYDEFSAATFGVTEGASRGNFPVTTGLSTTNSGSQNTDEKFTSIWGVIQATGVHWVWGRELQYGQYNGAYGAGAQNPDIDPDYYNITESRGWVAQESERATRGVLLGGKYNNATLSGSRCLDLADALQDYSLSISARGMAAHVCLNG